MKEKTISCPQKLENLQQEFDEFTYIVTHDLKAPLRAVGNLSSWIKEDLGDDLSPDVQHNIHLLQNRAERLERMVNALLAYSRCTRHELDIREVRFMDLVKKVAADLQLTHPFTLHIPEPPASAPELPAFFTYARKLEMVLEQLLQNAAKFNDKAEPQVWVEAHLEENELEFTIRDNGAGISEDSLEKVFKIFYTGQPQDQQESLGVGLALTRKIVRFVGGAISVQSTKGAGSTFRVRWPLSPTSA